MKLKTSPETLKKGIAVAALMLAGGGAYTSLEGNLGKPYKDVGGVWTDCYGNTGSVSAQRIRSEKECRELLSGATQRLGEKIYNKTNGLITAQTLAAYISFSYNAGYDAFLKSTLLKKHLDGDYRGACKELFRWVYVKGVYVEGLYNRRKVEYSACMKGIPQNV